MAFPRAALAALILAAAPAAADPTYWRVTGVADDDTLNVRAEPDADSEDIGDLYPGTGGIEVGALDDTGDWGRIVWEEGNGWIAMRFLAPDPQPAIGETGLPAGLLCGGTEPFWSLRLAYGSATYSDIEGTLLQLSQTKALVAEGRLSTPALLAHAAADAETLSVVGPASCSDGMSDRIYPWRIHLLLGGSQESRFLTGCCQLPLEAGQN